MKKEKKHLQLKNNTAQKHVKVNKNTLEKTEEEPIRSGILPERDLKKNLGCG
jgi:hypothetical protein